MNKKLISLALSIMLLMTTGCANIHVDINLKQASPETQSAAESQSASETSDAVSKDTAKTADETIAATEAPETGGGKPWIDSDLKENVSADTFIDPRDDYHLYVNKQWILENDIPAGHVSWSNYEKRSLEVKQQCIELLSDESLTGHDAELIQTYNRLVLDWDARNAAGVKEIKDLYDTILAIKDTADVTRLLTDEETSDRLYSFVVVGVDTGLDDPDSYIGGVSTPSLLLIDSAEYTVRSELGEMYYGYCKDMFTYIAQKMGMDSAEASKRFDNAIDLEAVLATRIYTTKETHSTDYIQKINNEMSFEDTAALSKVFPLKDIMETSLRGYDGVFLVMRPDYFEVLDSIYTNENIDAIRDLILVRYLLSYPGILDRDTYEMTNELSSKYFGTSGTVSDEEMAYNYVSGNLPTSMQKVYISKYGSEKDKQKMTDLCRQVIDTYREMLSENEWASDEVKDYALEKLDKMTIHAAYPDKFRDTSGIDISGCSLIEANRRIDDANTEYWLSLLGTKRDEEMWADNFDILLCNAFYSFNDNTINMIIGMMGEPFYSSDMSTEELYASIGAFWVGHEISHAFDNNGSQFDAEGKLRNWWTAKDKEEFDRRVAKVDKYLDRIIAFDDKHFIGSNIDTEMIADITGLQCALRMASKIDGFDYDLFFSKFATMNVNLALYSNELSTLTQDEHPLEYSRTNVPVQQFEEFYETYSVQPGDNMYLAPEDRLTVW